MDPSVEKEFLRHTVRLTTAGTHSQVRPGNWEMPHRSPPAGHTASPSAAMTSALRG